MSWEKGMKNAYRADHVGSLLRPSRLLEARRERRKGRLSSEALATIEDEAILAVLALQRETGIEVVSDGEFRRSSWLGGFLEAAEGFVVPESALRSAATVWQGGGAEVANEGAPSLPVIGGKLKVGGRFTERESAFLAKHADRPFKLTLPSPTMMLVFYREGISDKAYPDRQKLIDDVVTIYAREIEALAAARVPYIQIDSLRYADLIDPERREKLEPLGLGRVLAQALAADNALLARAKREGTTRAVHICRGNHRSAWFGRGGYEAVAERLFNELDADRFLLEFDDERSGGFAPLRFVPEGKIVVLGLVTTKSAALESPDELLRRIEEASKYLSLDQLALSPQCGFASTELGNLLGEDDEKRKLELVVATARRVWG